MTRGAGFEIATIVAEPSVVTVEGDADQLAELSHVSTLPVSLAGASSDVSTVVSLDLPTGVVVLGSDVKPVLHHPSSQSP